MREMPHPGGARVPSLPEAAPPASLPVPVAGPSAPAAQPATATRRESIALMATPALEVYLDRWMSGTNRSLFGTPGIHIEPVAGALAQMCAGKALDSPDLLLIERRMTEAEQHRCTGLEETHIGHEVAVLARSTLYDPPALSTRDVFLALARRVPDPEHPGGLINNPYHLWNEIDPALPPDPIRVIGPAPGSPLLAVLLQPGCLRVLPPSADESLCRTVRTDEAYMEYHEAGLAVVRELQINPTWLGVVSLRMVASSRGDLAVNPLDGVAPDAASVLSGTYPASRAVYLYINTTHFWANPALSTYAPRYRQLPQSGLVGVPDSALVSLRELQSSLPPHQPP
jgi:phosphate transport system substrate-binding protein